VAGADGKPGVDCPAELATLMSRVRGFYDPDAVWLFGSRARGRRSGRHP
jgi:hypothetical protein